MRGLGTLSRRLHTGELSVDLVGRRRLWYTLSALILLAALAGIGVRGLHLGIEFQGGSQYTVTKPGLSVTQAQQAADRITGGHQSVVQATGGGKVRVQVGSEAGVTSQAFSAALAKDLDVPRASVDAQSVGPSWGRQISEKALLGLAIFMVLVTVYLAWAFEWRMACAALVALLHDLVITIGVYALAGFEVTPGTVIGFLTILGYSLYDTVVVFDGVKDATKGIAGQSGRTYSQAANHALNQTLVRSVNTTVIALLPVAALLFIGGGLLGAGTLDDISLALFIGLAAGAYSSICVATPLLAQLKEREPAMRALVRRGADRACGLGAPAGSAASVPESDTSADRLVSGHA